MNKWQHYEQEKIRLKTMLLAGQITYDQYDRLIRELCKRLGI